MSETLKDNVALAFKTCNELETENTKLREALEIYADKKSWGTISAWCDIKDVWEKTEDHGYELARKTIDELGD